MMSAAFASVPVVCKAGNVEGHHHQTPSAEEGRSHMNDNSNYQDIYKQYYEQEPVTPVNLTESYEILRRRGFASLYSFLGVEENQRGGRVDGYEFLAIEKRRDIENKHRDNLVENNEFKDIIALCEACIAVFASEETRVQYDNWITYEIRKDILEKTLTAAGANQYLTESSYCRSISALINMGLNKEEAIILVRAFCYVRDIRHDDIDYDDYERRKQEARDVASKAAETAAECLKQARTHAAMATQPVEGIDDVLSQLSSLSNDISRNEQSVIRELEFYFNELIDEVNLESESGYREFYSNDELARVIATAKSGIKQSIESVKLAIVNLGRAADTADEMVAMTERAWSRADSAANEALDRARDLDLEDIELLRDEAIAAKEQAEQSLEAVTASSEQAIELRNRVTNELAKSQNAAQNGEQVLQNERTRARTVIANGINNTVVKAVSDVKNCKWPTIGAAMMCFTLGNVSIIFSFLSYPLFIFGFNMLLRGKRRLPHIKGAENSTVLGLVAVLIMMIIVTVLQLTMPLSAH